MPNIPMPPATSPAALPTAVRLKIVSPTAEPPNGAGWLHEIKYDGHRLPAIVDGAVLVRRERVSL